MIEMTAFRLFQDILEFFKKIFHSLSFMSLKHIITSKTAHNF